MILDSLLADYPLPSSLAACCSVSLMVSSSVYPVEKLQLVVPLATLYAGLSLRVVQLRLSDHLSVPHNTPVGLLCVWRASP